MNSPRIPLARLAVVLVLAALAVAACGGGASPSPISSPAPSTPSPTSLPSAARAAALPGTTWFVTGFAGATGVATAVIPGTTVTLDFGRDGNAGGSAGCNRYGGSYASDATAGSLAFGALMQTEMACTPDATMAQESGYLAALTRTAAYRISDGRLQLLDAGGALLVEAEPAPTS